MRGRWHWQSGSSWAQQSIDATHVVAVAPLRPEDTAIGTCCTSDQHQLLLSRHGGSRPPRASRVGLCALTGRLSQPAPRSRAITSPARRAGSVWIVDPGGSNNASGAGLLKRVPEGQGCRRLPGAAPATGTRWELYKNHLKCRGTRRDCSLDLVRLDLERDGGV
jgi:hypothetical protein